LFAPRRQRLTNARPLVRRATLLRLRGAQEATRDRELAALVGGLGDGEEAADDHGRLVREDGVQAQLQLRALVVDVDGGERQPAAALVVPAGEGRAFAAEGALHRARAGRPAAEGDVEDDEA